MTEVKNFEKYLKQYNEINKKLEDDDLILDEKIKLYEESTDLYIKLNKIIDEATLKVEGINKRYEDL